jgi:ribonuclease HI
MPFRPDPAQSRFRSSEFQSSSRNAPQNYLVAHIDGGSRGNPGPSGYGVVIEDEVGRPVAELSEFLGKQTNNYAEYSGLLAALSYALKQSSKALKVVSDSELLVKQIRGQYKVNNPGLKELYVQATRMIGQLEWFEIGHVLREKNREADRLANVAMDRGTRRTSAMDGTQTGTVATKATEVNGIVRNGTIEFLGERFPDGTLVKIRAVKP